MGGDEWTPMSPERRRELLERLIARTMDPKGLDWECLRALDPQSLLRDQPKPEGRSPFPKDDSGSSGG